eukprot:TRINITY_DN5852_c0_g1_i1.p1 TRINITY_DN5852_c0_g1~~TRINITY_DN5852_c0_g1_i1.p1  ORF type:complete len:595 (+),score=119.17 TRINITY_DN5852_c0_g1_i1:122-1786(+)
MALFTRLAKVEQDVKILMKSASSTVSDRPKLKKVKPIRDISKSAMVMRKKKDDQSNEMPAEEPIVRKSKSQNSGINKKKRKRRKSNKPKRKGIEEGPSGTTSRRNSEIPALIKSKSSASSLHLQADKSGWLELRTLKIFSSRFFVLNGLWLSYYKNDACKDCYGHIYLKDCTVKSSKKYDTVFIIQHKDKKDLFRSKGKRGSAAVSVGHRIFLQIDQGTNKCKVRAPDTATNNDWIATIKKNMSLANALEKKEIPGPNKDKGENTKSEENYRTSEDEYESEDSWGDFQTACEELSDDDSEFWTEDESISIKLWSDKKQEVIDQVKAIIGSDTIAAERMSDNDLWRFLVARSWDIPATVKQLQDFFAWRKDYQPTKILASQVQNEISHQKIITCGKNKANRPLLVVFAKKHNSKISTPEQTLRFACYVLEEAIRMMKDTPSIMTFDVIVDMRDVGWGQIDLGFAKTAAQTLQQFYPERLGKLICVNCGFVIHAMWRAIKSFIEDSTRKKYTFLKDPKDLLKLDDLFDESIIMTEFGGKAEWVVQPNSIHAKKITT